MQASRQCWKVKIHDSASGIGVTNNAHNELWDSCWKGWAYLPHGVNVVLLFGLQSAIVGFGKSPNVYI
jgi:hypothetical protein